MGNSESLYNTIEFNNSNDILPDISTHGLDPINEFISYDKNTIIVRAKKQLSTTKFIIRRHYVDKKIVKTLFSRR